MADHPTRDDIDLLAGSFYSEDPHEKWTWMRGNAPVYWDGSVWAVTKYADVRAVSKNPGLFSSTGGIRPDAPALPQMIDMDDPDHFNRRKVVNKGFTPRRVREKEDRLHEVCDWIIDQVSEKGECDFVRDIAAPLPMIMIGDELGVAREERDTLLRWSDEMVSALTGHQTDEDMVQAATAFSEYSQYATDVIARRRAEPTDDLVSTLVQAQVDGVKLDDDELVHETLLILVGGDETTRHVISGGMYQLLENPDQYTALTADRERLGSAVEEMLRWVSPIKNMCRHVSEDTELSGQQLNSGDKLLLMYPSANRDEEVFDDPFVFDIHRDPNDHVAFGFGTHFCLGASLARLELKVMFEHLLDRLPDLALVVPGEPDRRRANFISGYEQMPVTFAPTPSRSTAMV